MPKMESFDGKKKTTAREHERTTQSGKKTTVRKHERKLIKEWNKGEIPDNKTDWNTLLQNTNNELASGYWAVQPERLNELREIKYYAQEELEKINTEEEMAESFLKSRFVSDDSDMRFAINNNQAYKEYTDLANERGFQYANWFYGYDYDPELVGKPMTLGFSDVIKQAVLIQDWVTEDDEGNPKNPDYINSLTDEQLKLSLKKSYINAHNDAIDLAIPQIRKLSKDFTKKDKGEIKNTFPPFVTKQIIKMVDREGLTTPENWDYRNWENEDGNEFITFHKMSGVTSRTGYGMTSPSKSMENLRIVENKEHGTWDVSYNNKIKDERLVGRFNNKVKAMGYAQDIIDLYYKDTKQVKKESEQKSEKLPPHLQKVVDDYEEKRLKSKFKVSDFKVEGYTVE